MRSDPLLTQAELDFIQQLSSPQPRKRRPSEAQTRRLAIGAQLRELLNHLGSDEQISLDTHSDHEHLSFPLRLIQDGQSRSRLELGAPLIFEQGASERPWRLPLPVPLTLLDSNEKPSGLQALELSNNGMLVQRIAPGSPAKDQLLQLLLPQQRCVQLRARLVRRISKTRYAYSLQTLHDEDEQTLRQYLFEQHSSRQHRSDPVA
jgi:hypothetical protein